ncbi:uncharacterized protein LOC133151726 isoform X1 [Syngnathus typhle]|uniref:uncharacterized protein LOC133151726 isoform X1 n=1 Tax=Syngnathus typhle TaxID=161592 RepID=UPI002A6A5714|nr:uncharacterized protein LOC133151726 isoform X1 [Syngnathus typhle]
MCALLGQTLKDTDIECQENRRRDRGRCLDVCMVGSILVLYAALAAMAVVCLPVLMTHGDSKLQPYRSANEEQTQSPPYKMQNFAFLEAISSKLVNSTVQWDSVHYGTGKSVGTTFHFDSKQHSLRPRKAGMYFIYLNLNLTCTYNCNAGLLSVNVGDTLSCQVKLLADTPRQSKKCWTVSWLNGDTSLLTQMSVPEEGLQDWKLELNGSNLGIFLVD